MTESSAPTHNVFFVEKPYAAALESDQILLRCANCFGESIPQVPACECNRVSYCSDSCREDDCYLHQFECEAEKLGNRKSPNRNIESKVRLLGRLIARKRLDGGTADLSTGFPHHLSDDRRLSDMISHRLAIRFHASRNHFAKNVIKGFLAYFANTKLANEKRSSVMRMHCVSAINSFRVSCRRVDDLPDSYAGMGTALYLNASRFNHSCCATLYYYFEGNRIVIKLVDNGNEPHTKEQLDGLTLNYGAASYGTSFALTNYRLKSLKGRYFFRCQCKLCSDTERDQLAANASNVECQYCAKPYVWHTGRRGKFYLKRLCSCSECKPKIYVDRSIADKIFLLEQSWKPIMQSLRDETDHWLVSNRLNPLLNTIDSYWHRNWNLRRGQTYELLFKVCHLRFCYGECKNQDAVREGTIYGEAMMQVYQNYYEDFHSALAIHAQRLARLHILLEERERFANWMAVAKKVWKIRGEYACLPFFENLEVFS